MDPLWRWTLAVIAGGGLAGAVQGSTVLVRAASTATTGGLANPVVATGELASAVAVTSFALLVPGADSARGGDRPPAHHPVGAAPPGGERAARRAATRAGSGGAAASMIGARRQDATAADRRGRDRRPARLVQQQHADAHRRPQSRSRACCAAAGLEPTHVVVPYRLSAEMKKWLNEHVPKALPNHEDRILYLSRSLFRSDEFKIEYVRGYTGTAMEVFETQQANCLAFTLLFIGMARELGVPAYFLEVRDSENYRKEGDLIVVSDHVAVGYGPSYDLRIIDFGAREDAAYRRITLIDDYRAIAMFYSNRGAEELRSGRYDEALDWLRSAVAIDPEYAGSWVNLGVALRRSGDVENAELSYRTALELDLHSTSALQNLAALLHFKGHEEEALDLLAAGRSRLEPQPLHLPHAGRPQHAPRPHGRGRALLPQGAQAPGRERRVARRDGPVDARAGRPEGGARPGCKRAEELDKDAARVALLRRRLRCRDLERLKHVWRCRRRGRRDVLGTLARRLRIPPSRSTTRSAFSP